MTTRRRIRLLALALPVALLAPVAAHAEKVETIDPAADVLLLGETEQGGDDLDNVVPAPDNLTADVVGTVVDHTSSRLRVRVELRGLSRSRTDFAVLRVRTPAGSFEVEVDKPGRRPDLDMTRRSEEIACPRLRATNDHATARVTVTIPSSCLGRPRWVQVGAGVVSLGTATTAEGTEQVVVLADDAHRDGEIRGRIALGPKVHRD